MKNTIIKIKSLLNEEAVISEKKRIFFDSRGAMEEITAVLAAYFCKLAAYWKQRGDRNIRLFIHFDVAAFINKRQRKLAVIEEWSAFFFQRIKPWLEEEKSIHFEISCGVSNEFEEENEDQVRVYSIGIDLFSGGELFRFEVFQNRCTDRVSFESTRGTSVVRTERDRVGKEVFTDLNKALDRLEKCIQAISDK